MMAAVVPAESATENSSVLRQCVQTEPVSMVTSFQMQPARILTQRRRRPRGAVVLPPVPVSHCHWLFSCSWDWALPSVVGGWRNFHHGDFMSAIRYKVNKDAAWRVVGGELFVVTADGSLHNIKADSGLFLWRKLEKGATVPELVSALTENYEVDEQTAVADVDEFVETLVLKQALIRL